jgi:hypothetical protein
VLDYSKTPLQWFMDLYPDLSRDDARKWLGRCVVARPFVSFPPVRSSLPYLAPRMSRVFRYGTGGAPQTQPISQLSEGQKVKGSMACRRG